MSSDFDWQVGTEPDWQQPATESDDFAPPSRRLWLILIVVVIVLASSLYFFLRERSSDVETAVHQDIIAAHSLVWQTAQRGDRELFESLLLLKAPQQGSAIRNTAFKMALPQLNLTAQFPTPENITVDIAPTLDTAQVTAEILYETAVGDPVRLQHIYIYQLQDERWLLSTPNANFWGDTQQEASPWLEITYPAHDAPIVQQLATDLNTVIHNLCPDTHLYCPIILPLQLNLTTSGLTNSYPHFSRATLPTPTLLGTPTDESGYQLLFRYYGRYLTDLLWKLVPDAASGTVMHNGRFTQAAWKQQLIEHGIYIWPPPADPLPPDLPNATLATLCLDEAQTGLEWWHYQTETAVWHKTTSLTTISAAIPLDNNIFLLQRKSDQQTEWLLTWPDGTHQTIYTTTSSQGQIVPYPDGQHLRLLNADNNDLLQLDITACNPTTCTWDIVEETAVISPNGRQQISQYGSNIIHHKQDGRSTTTSNAFAPFWLQEQFYGYLRPLSNSAADVQVFLRNTSNNETYPVFTTHEIRSRLPNNPETIIITSLTPIPNDINQITVQAYAPAQQQTFTFAFYRSTGILERLNTNSAASPNPNPNTPWHSEINNGLITLTSTYNDSSFPLNPPTPTCAYTAWLVSNL